jgi:hypothetical protein
MYWWDWLAAPVIMVPYKRIVMLAAPTSPNRQVDMTYYWTGVSGRENKNILRLRPNKKRKGHL